MIRTAEGPQFTVTSSNSNEAENLDSDLEDKADTMIKEGDEAVQEEE